MAGKGKLKVVAIYFGEGPSTYVRLISRLADHKSDTISWESINFKPTVLSNRYRSSNFFFRATNKVAGYFLQIYALIKSIPVIIRSDIIFVVKYPNMLSWRFLKFFKKPIVFDFDDPIWLDGFLGIEKFNYYLSNSDGFTCDNEILFAKAAKMVDKGLIVSGYVPEIEKSIKDNSKNKFQIIWIGSPSTKKYISSIESELVSVYNLSENINFLFLGITDLDGFRNLSRVTFLENYDLEIMRKHLIQSDIGLFPTFDDELGAARGLHKLNVYLACGVIPICSNVGLAGSAIYEIGAGFICKNYSDWSKNISQIVLDKELFRTQNNAIANKFNGKLVNSKSIKELEKFIEYVYLQHI